MPCISYVVRHRRSTAFCNRFDLVSVRVPNFLVLMKLAATFNSSYQSQSPTNRTEPWSFSSGQFEQLNFYFLTLPRLDDNRSDLNAFRYFFPTLHCCLPLGSVFVCTQHNTTHSLQLQPVSKSRSSSSRRRGRRFSSLFLLWFGWFSLHRRSFLPSRDGHHLLLPKHRKICTERKFSRFFP